MFVHVSVISETGRSSMLLPGVLPKKTGYLMSFIIIIGRLAEIRYQHADLLMQTG